jgi:hypothetical protein
MMQKTYARSWTLPYVLNIFFENNITMVEIDPMKPSNVCAVALFLLSCTNPQSTRPIPLNIDSGILGKWKELKTGLLYTFNSDGNYTCLDTNPNGADNSYTEQYRTYFDRYVNITYDFGRMCLFVCPSIAASPEKRGG